MEALKRSDELPRVEQEIHHREYDELQLIKKYIDQCIRMNYTLQQIYLNFLLKNLVDSKGNGIWSLNQLFIENFYFEKLKNKMKVYKLFLISIIIMIVPVPLGTGLNGDI